MDISIIDVQKAIEFKLMPDVLIQTMTEKGGFVVLAHDDDEIKGMSVISYAEMAAEMSLEYIFVLSRYRGTGLAGQMMDYTYDFLKRAEVKLITCTIIGTMDFAVPLYSFLTEQKFELIVAYYHFIEYKLGDIINSKKFAPMFGKIPKCISGLKDLRDLQMRKFGNRLAERGVAFDSRKYDQDISCFYIREDEIEGCMLANIRDNMAVIEYVYIDGDSHDPVVFPGMLAVCVSTAYSKLGADALCRIYLQYSDMYEALKKVLGEPVEDMLIQQYEKTL